MNAITWNSSLCHWLWKQSFAFIKLTSSAMLIRLILLSSCEFHAYNDIFMVSYLVSNFCPMLWVKVQTQHVAHWSSNPCGKVVQTCCPSALQCQGSRHDLSSLEPNIFFHTSTEPSSLFSKVSAQSSTMQSLCLYANLLHIHVLVK